jgi:hypothetical protein
VGWRWLTRATSRVRQLLRAAPMVAVRALNLSRPGAVIADLLDRSCCGY